MTPQEALVAAVTACETAAELARRIGVTAQAVSQWDVVPPTRVLAVERATGGAVTRQDLRPDIYPNDSPAAESAGKMTGEAA